jgi:hypothetical protein
LSEQPRRSTAKAHPNQNQQERLDTGGTQRHHFELGVGLCFEPLFALGLRQVDAQVRVYSIDFLLDAVPVVCGRSPGQCSRQLSVLGVKITTAQHNERTIVKRADVLHVAT